MPSQNQLAEPATARIDLWSVRWCGYCIAAQRLLDARTIPYRFHDLTGQHDAVLDLKRHTGHTTMPQIFLDGALLGGYDELRRYLREHGVDAVKPE